MREKEIETYLVQQCKTNDILTRKVTWFLQRGAPDRMLITLNGTLVWVELKAPGKKLSAPQKREHARLSERGQRIVVIDSIAGVDELIRGLM